MKKLFSSPNHHRMAGLALASLSALTLAISACAQSSIPVGKISVPAQPATHHITAAELPPPFASPSVNNGQRIIPRPEGATLHVPPGFRIGEWATGLENPRSMTVAPNGDVFVSESRPGRVSMLRSGADGKPVISHFATGLSQPFGIAFYPNGANPQYIYIANTDSVVRFPYRNGDTKVRGAGEKIADLPGGGYNQHWTRMILFSPDSKKLYISVGSRSNVGEEEPPRASIMVCNPDGSGMRVFATGLRNAVSMSFNPVSRALWAAVNERDGLGDRIPPDYVTSVKSGGFYGWPYCYIGQHHDPRMPSKPELEAKAIVPDVLLEAHCAALSIEFDTGRLFPRQYHNDGFAALHGSWNRSDLSGYKVIRIPMNANGTAKGGYEDFVWGWNSPDGVWGRPVAAVFLKDGSMIVSDDGSDKIWRVSYTGKR